MKKIKNKKKEGILSKPILWGLGKEKNSFVENLAMLFSSGMDISYSLESLRSETRSRGMKYVIGQIQEEISAGSPIWRAFQKIDFFPEQVISLLRIGEESGRLSENLRVIAEQEQKNRIFKSKIRSAMMYPVFVMVLAVVIALGIAWFILPKLATVFSQLRMDLPFLTKLLIRTGNFMDKYGFEFVPAVLVILILVIFFIFFFSKTKFIGQVILLHFPGVGILIKEVEIGRFGYLLGTMLGAGVPVLNAIESLAKSTSINSYGKMYSFLKERLTEGNSFHKSFMLYPESRNLIPAHVQNMVFAAEKSGKLSPALLNIGRMYEEKVETTTKNLSVILEPVLLVIVWLGVVAIALAIIMPIYSLIGGLNKNSGGNPVAPSRPAPIETVTIAPLTESQDNKSQVEEQSRVLSKVKISETGVGFLNVRDVPSSKGKIVNKVKPGEEYELRNQENGWYEIIISETVSGWISAQYAEINN